MHFPFGTGPKAALKRLLHGLPNDRSIWEMMFVNMSDCKYE